MVFCIQKSDFSTRIASLFESLPSSVVLYIQNGDIMTRINSLLWVPDHICRFVHAKQRD